MNDFINRMIEKRSCKNFKSDPVPEDMINDIIQAGLYAPTGMGQQSPIVVAITEKKTRDALAKLNASIIGMPEDADPFYGAPCVLIVLAKKSIGTYVYDGSIMMENMLLAADSLGLGSCWIHRAKEEFEKEDMKMFLKKLGVQEEYEGIGHCVVGYKKAPLKEAAPRKDGRVFWVR